ncbi:putative phosphatase [Rhodopirellula islandica]|uniref:Phosphatase n=1 Tax=Rhodopirellula islandica TaxID=595434 RepID=A0A0J1B8W4_RHOIS|nr:DUF1015 domain-containing protein [Rhodopirellula islandica]KLU02891.1 putative phosphatase [Rhodopirellula islandica]
MPEVTPFAALRYNLDHIRSLSEVVAPPYDVIDAEYQEVLYKRHPSNVIRVILNREEPGDEIDETYSRAAGFVQQWISEGVLKQDDEPGFYLYHQTFAISGESGDQESVTRRGFMGRVRLEPFGKGNIHPHEETHPKAKVDRLKLMKATEQNNSPIFGLYPDNDNAVIECLEAAKADVTPIEATDDAGVVHTVWPITDPDAVTKASQLLADKPMFVADGHHRYETACDYRDFVAEQAGGIAPDHPVNFVMTMLVGMNDPGLVVLPTHRLIRGIRPMRSEELIKRLGNGFNCETLSGGLSAADDAWTRIQLADRQSLMALYAVGDETWVMVNANENAMARMAEIAGDQSETWRSLGVSLLHKLVLEDCLGESGHPKPTYIHDVADVVAGLKGESQAAESEGDGDYTFAALVMPATVSDIEQISLNHERMPAKSTYFYPKLLSGLAFHRLTP